MGKYPGQKPYGPVSDVLRDDLHVILYDTIDGAITFDLEDCISEEVYEAVSPTLMEDIHETLHIAFYESLHGTLRTGEV